MVDLAKCYAAIRDAVWNRDRRSVMRARDVGENLRVVDSHVEVLEDGRFKRGKRSPSHGMPF